LIQTNIRRCGVFLLGLLLAQSVFSQSAIDQLVEQTGIEPGPVAARDFPGWRPPQKIVVRDIAGLYDEVEGTVPGVNLVRVKSESEAVANAADADAIVGFCSPRVLAAASDAIWIQVFGAGAERCLAVDRVRRGDVMLTNMQKMSSPVIGEHVTAMVLSLARGLVPLGKAMESGKWSRGSETISGMQSYGGKTVLIVGLGGIGTEAARRLAALDMRIIATRRSSREGPDFVDYVGLSHELLELAPQADFIVNALPHTPETEGTFDAAFFDVVKRGAHFINVGRGKTVVTADLVTALESGQIAGAALDVTDPEPLPSRIRHNILVRENLRRFSAGEALLNVVDPELGY
jgi:phosphoglycerate dehydrogenase-like enzyme